VEYSGLWILALRQLEYPDADSYYTYGHFCATLNLANAYRYVRNPYRSEFIQVLAEALKLLGHVGDPFAQSVHERFPEVALAIESTDLPVVIELSGIPQGRLLNRAGGPNIKAALDDWRLMQTYEGVNAPADFIIRDVTSADVVAVHDLRDWPLDEIGDASWRPNESKVAAVRLSPSDWLAAN
jgi:hypothetical protein